MPLINLNTLIVVVSDLLLLAAALFASYYLRFNFDIPDNTFAQLVRLAPVLVLIKIVVFYFFNLYRGMWRYTSTKDLFNIVKASIFNILFIAALLLFTNNLAGFPRSVFIIDGALTIILIAGSRISIRLFFELGSEGKRRINILNLLFAWNPQKPKGAKNLLIIGAGNTGEKIFREIRDNANLKYHVVGYVDDNPAKLSKMIHGIPVMGKTEQIIDIINRTHAEEILLAIPSATADQMRTIVSYCKEADIPFKTLPGLGELIDGKITVNAIREVAYRDLIGREVIRLDRDSIGSYLSGTCILVTGAGGSIGSELCRQICRFRPKTLILYERAESPLYDIELELKNNYPEVTIIPTLADIRDRKRLEDIFGFYKPEVVFHAAAYKHVPMLEIQPWEAITNNVLGTKNVVEVAKSFNVARFVLVSTDKAVRPTNIMGSSKRIGELIVQAHNNREGNGTRFMIVRFGNVVGSVGSVIPLFKKQIASGGPVTVTHPDITRFFMTIPEASQLILQAGSMGSGGEIFILDMGQSLKILDIAKDLIRLSGFKPDVDIPIKFIGLRAGEKLYEELITEGEGIVPTSHDKIMVLRGDGYDPERVTSCVNDLIDVSKKQDISQIKAFIKRLVPEYQPQEKLAD